MKQFNEFFDSRKKKTKKPSFKEKTEKINIVKKVSQTANVIAQQSKLKIFKAAKLSDANIEEMKKILIQLKKIEKEIFNL